jgi:hypothetical protein
MVIAIDFDGTCVTHEFPRLGKDIGAVPVLKELISNGHRLILFTMRSDQYLKDAVNWFKKNEIALYGIQTNPTQSQWTKSPKAYAELYIDDAALGCPLLVDTIFLDDEKIQNSGRPYVDWGAVREILIEQKIIKA